MQCGGQSCSSKQQSIGNSTVLLLITQLLGSELDLDLCHTTKLRKKTGRDKGRNALQHRNDPVVVCQFAAVHFFTKRGSGETPEESDSEYESDDQEVSESLLLVPYKPLRMA